MKNSWPLKISILATVLITLAGCPALSSLMELISREQAKPKKILTVTGIPSEYEGSFMQVVASDSSDALSERLCLSGGMDSRDVKEGKGKSLILEMNAHKANTNISALVTTTKNVMGIAESCDSKERFVILSFLPKGEHTEENADVSKLMEENLKNMFLYTKGVNICNASADVASKAKLTYSFSEMESMLKFSDFMRASDCEVLVEIVRAMSGSSEEYIVIKKDGLDVKETSSGKIIGHIVKGETVKKTKEKGNMRNGEFSWIEVNYGKDIYGNNKKGWITEKKYIGNSTTVDKEYIISKAGLEAEGYFVITDQSKEQRNNRENTFQIRSTADNSDNNNVVDTLNAGDIINVVLPIDRIEFCNRNNFKYYFVKVYYYNPKEKKMNCGWAIEKRYLVSKPDQPEELIHKDEQIVTDFKDYPDTLWKKVGKNSIEIKDTKIADGNSIPTKRAILGGYGGGGEVPQDKGRYCVAVGPRILYKNYPDYGECKAKGGGEFSGFSRYIKVELQYEDKEPIEIECVVGDIKAHTYTEYPDISHDKNDKRSIGSKNAEYPSSIKKGEMQTGIMYPKAKNDEKFVEEDNMDGSVIEFMGGKITKGKLANKDLQYIKISKITSNVSRDGLFFEGNPCKQ